MTRQTFALLLIVGLSAAACHPGPVLTPKVAGVGGTIAGVVTTSDNMPAEGRTVTAVNVASGARFEAKTGPDGGYTMQVPEGSYRLDLALRSGEVLTKQPGETKIDKSDLDSGRNFVIGTKAPI